MYEINKPVAYESLMEEVMELVTACGGWDGEAQTFKPGVNEQIRMNSLHARQAIGLPITD